MNSLLLSWCLLLLVVVVQLEVGVVESAALVASLPSTPLWGYRSTLLVRGGGDDDDEEEDDEEEEEEAVESPKAEAVDDDDEVDEKEDEEEEVAPTKKESVKLDAALAAAALKSASKAKVAQQASVKKAVNVQLKAKASTKQRRIFPRIPYILRATLNPFTLMAMTKSYWASLFNLNYLQQKTASGQELRSAVEEQAKRNPKPASSFSGRKRTMKRGQAKTLNDLPKLSS